MSKISEPVFLQGLWQTRSNRGDVRNKIHQIHSLKHTALHHLLVLVGMHISCGGALLFCNKVFFRVKSVKIVLGACRDTVILSRLWGIHINNMYVYIYLFTVHTLFHNCDLLVRYKMGFQPSKRTTFDIFRKSSTASSFPPWANGQARIHPETKTHPPKSRFLPSKWERMKAPGWFLLEESRLPTQNEDGTWKWTEVKMPFGNHHFRVPMLFKTFPDVWGGCLWNVIFRFLKWTE